jgi:hypothetical protein
MRFVGLVISVCVVCIGVSRAEEAASREQVLKSVKGKVYVFDPRNGNKLPEAVALQEQVYDRRGNVVEKKIISVSDGTIRQHIVFTYDEKNRITGMKSALGADRQQEIFTAYHDDTKTGAVTVTIDGTDVYRAALVLDDAGRVVKERWSINLGDAGWQPAGTVTRTHTERTEIVTFRDRNDSVVQERIDVINARGILIDRIDSSPDGVTRHYKVDCDEGGIPTRITLRVRTEQADGTAVFERFIFEIMVEETSFHDE